MLACVLATLIFAIILGNVLGGKAREAKSRYNEKVDRDISLSLDSLGRAKLPEIYAFSVDMTTAVPEESLSNQTSEARELGNALFVPLLDTEGDLIYYSDLSSELGAKANDNLPLSRLFDHFNYYADYSCGYFSSDLDPDESSSTRLESSYSEISLLAELSQKGFDELLLRFANEPSDSDLLYYQSYLLEARLACPDALLGLYLSSDFCTQSDSASIIPELIQLCDYIAIDLSDKHSPDELDLSLSNLSSILLAYPSRIMIAYDGAEALYELQSVLDKHSISGFIALK